MPKRSSKPGKRGSQKKKSSGGLARTDGQALEAAHRNERGAASSQAPQQTHHYTEVSMWSGALPPPAIVQQYNQLVKNGAERLFHQMELNADSRRKTHNRRSFSEMYQRLVGASTGAIVLLGVTGVGLFLVITDRPVVGFAAVITGIATFLGSLGAYAWGRKQYGKDSAQTELDL